MKNTTNFLISSTYQQIALVIVGVTSRMTSRMTSCGDHVLSLSAWSQTSQEGFTFYCSFSLVISGEDCVVKLTI